MILQNKRQYKDVLPKVRYYSIFMCNALRLYFRREVTDLRYKI